MRKFNLPGDYANTVNSMVYFVAGFASPVMGFIVDKTGLNLFWVFISTILTVIAHMMLTFTTLNPLIMTVLFTTRPVDVCHCIVLCFR